MATRTREEALVLKAQAGDSRAFELLYRAYQPSLLKFALRMTGEEAAAKDAVQDAWIMVARTLKALHSPGMFRARIFKAVRWRALDQLRRRRHEPLPENGADGPEPKTPPMPTDGLATHDQIRALVKSLPEIERVAVYLFYLEEMRLGEIATVLDVPAGTVKSCLNRARRRLHERVTAEEGEWV